MENLEIEQRIKETLKQNDYLPLFYIESGSRLWGMASPNSDFDIRGLHLNPKSMYFDFKKHRDLVEVLDGDFDFVSYDIDKMFTLLSNSNPTVLEWIRSDIIYFNQMPEFETLKKNILENIDYKALFYHYISLAKNQFDPNKNVSYKNLLYIIRGIVSAKLATESVIPELKIRKMFEQLDKKDNLIEIAYICLDKKSQSDEKSHVEEKDREKFLQIVKEHLEIVGNIQMESVSKKQKLSEILSEYAIFLKTKFYG